MQLSHYAEIWLATTIRLVRIPKLDPLIILIITAVIVAIFAPARGSFADAFSLAANIAVALLFFLYGARLSTQEALKGLQHWRLHLIILVFTFVVFPILGILLSPTKFFLPHDIYLGILYLTLVPSTVQSSVAFTSIARGNVAGAIVSASASNLAGVILTPLLVMLIMSTGSGIHLDTSVFIDIAVQLLLPFILGQLCRRWIAKIAAHKATKVVDRGSIVMVVYSAFSAGMVQGIWSAVSVIDIVFLCILSVVMVLAMLWLTRALSAKLGFSREDQITIQFCGSKKSLATGLPMASVIFTSGPNVAMLILPLMIFHQIQLMICSALASHYSRNTHDTQKTPPLPS